jgi:tetratricopeptide (TPR) repeat protein
MQAVLLALLATGQDCQGLLAQGREAYERGRYEEAVPLFDRAAAACGPGESLLLALAQAQLLSRQPADTLRTLERLLALNPGYVEALKVKAKALYLEGRDDDAEATLATAGALAPADDEVPYNLGRIYYQQKRHRDAAEQFRRAIRLNPRSHKAHDNLGLATEALADVEQALRHYLKAIELVHKDHPRYDVVYANLADLMLKLGEYRRAFDLSAEAAERNPLDARNFFLTGKALVKLERLDLSLRWFERAIALDPHYASAYVGLGRIDLSAAALGWTADAEAALKRAEELALKAISLDEFNPAAHVLLGRTYARMQEYERAVEALKRAIALNPSEPDSYAGLGDALLWYGDSDGAIKSLETATAIDPRLSAEDLLSLGAAYFLAGRVADAAAILERIITRKEGNPFIYAMLAAAYVEGGRGQDSRSAAAEVRKLNPFFDVERFGSLFKRPEHREKLATALKKTGL